MNKLINCLLMIVAIGIFGCQNNAEQGLPIYGHMQLEEKEENGVKVIDTIFHTIPSFSFVDQDSNQVTNQTFDDRIYVADFFFTSCPDICPIMKTQMLRVYENFKSTDDLAFLSHTIDPKRDSVKVLKEYAERLGVDMPNKWYFVTGEKDDIFDIGYNGYLVTTDENKDAPGGFIHSGAFILIDKEKRIRGVYDGTNPEKVDLLMKDIPKLLQEYNLSTKP